MNEETIDPLWKLADLVSLQDAAALIAGYDPNHIDISYNDTDIQKKYPRLYPAERALRSAVKSGNLEAKIKAKRRYAADESEECGEPADDINMSATMVSVGKLKKWLQSKEITSGFFFSQSKEITDFLDKDNHNYAPKLAAAIRAWQAVNADPKLMNGKTVKQALSIWLRKNADQFGLTKDDGNPNEQGIQDIAKIANWNPTGGAPKTPD